MKNSSVFAFVKQSLITGSVCLLGSALIPFYVRADEVAVPNPEVTNALPQVELQENGLPKGYTLKPCLCVASPATITWTAFKFTNKTGVPGTFKDISHFSSSKATSNENVLTSLGFRGNLMSVDTANPARDETLTSQFFSKLSSQELSGHVVSLVGEQAVLRLSLNKTTKDVPFTVKVSEKGEIVATGSIDMLDFGMKEAHDSIHKACELLHTGEDKVSKTWTDVAIEVKAQITTDCDCD
jgi:polyisoprenoid-binding protein YceI